jgi:O-antigen/teichoic acid export membrane protein
VLMTRAVKARVKPLLKVVEYKYFILESLPQLGVVIFDSALSRMDIILLGILSTAAVTAEYSFVYKIYELSKLPLIIVAPVLLTRFSKMFAHGQLVNDSQKSAIRLFVKLELLVIMLIPVFLICVWSPVVDYFTNGKYGAVNEINFLVLAPCVPLICVVNFLWTLGFVQGQLKTIMYITIVVSVLNIALNFLFIPLYQSTGSAVAFLLSTIVQLALYLRYIDQRQVKFPVMNGVIILACAIVSVVTAKLLSNNIIFMAVIGIAVYLVLTIAARQLNLSELRKFAASGR